MMLYEPFYRRRGIRLISHLTNPPMSSFTKLQLPKNSAIHLPMWDDDSISITQDHHLLKHIKKIMFLYISDVYSVDAPLNNPRFNPENFGKYIRMHYMQNRRFRKLAVDQVIPDEQTMTVYTHGVLNRRYKYIGKKLSSGFAKWHDYHITVFDTAMKAMENDRRNHFIVLEVPSHLPTMSNLIQFGNQPVTFQLRLIRKFPRPDHWLVWALWKLIYGETEESGIFRSIYPKVLPRLNLILKYEDKCTIVNLARLLRFTQSWDQIWVDNGIEFPPAQYPVVRFRKYLLNLLMVIREKQIDVDEVEVLTDDQEEEIEELQELDEATPKTTNTRKAAAKMLDDLFPGSGAPNPISKPNSFQTGKARNLKAKTGEEVDVTELNEKEDVEADVNLEQEVDERIEALEEYNDTIVLTEEEAEELGLDKEEESDEDDEKVKTPAAVVRAEDLAYTDYRATVLDDKPEDKAIQVAKKMARGGTLTAGELRRAEKLSKKYHQLKSPYDKEKSFVDLLSVSNEETQMSNDTEIADDKLMDLVPDKSMNKSTLKTMDQKYVNDVLPKHMVQSVMAINKMGITVQKYDVDRVTTHTDDFEVHTVQVETVAGKQSTIRFRVPVVDKEGYIKINGTKYMMRKQWNDLPIRKVGPTEVALTSYYSKMFINRTERAAYNFERWLLNELTAKSVESDDFKDVKFNDVFYNKADLPRLYTMLSRKFSAFTYRNYKFSFDYKKIESIFGEKPKDGLIPVAIKGESIIVYMDKDGAIHEKGKVTDLLTFLDVDTSKAPDDYAEINLYGKNIPLVCILGYHLGLGNLLKTLGVDYLRVRKSKASEIVEDIYLTVRFKDEVLAFNRKDEMACLIVNGLNRYKNDVRKRDVYDYDKPEAWSSLFDNNGLDQRYLKEVQTMFPLWVDPITEGVLKQMGEPTDLVLLMLRAVTMLLSDEHPDVMDTDFMRIRGYERLSGFVYAEVVKALRDYNYRPTRKDKALTMHPDTVWYSIIRDESMDVKTGSNPIHNLKEQEIVVYRGSGGRCSRSMVAENRKYHRHAMGVISEATVDSGDAGTVTYLSSNPNVVNLYGMVSKDKPNVNSKDAMETSSMVSTSFLLAVGADIDDQK